MAAVTPESRYTVVEMRSREIDYSLADLARFAGVDVNVVMAVATRGRLQGWLRTNAVEEMFRPVTEVDFDFGASLIPDPAVYAVLDPEDENQVGMPLAEGKCAELDELLMPGTYLALRNGTGDPITLMVG